MFGEYWSPNQSMYYSSYTKSFIKTKVKQKNIQQPRRQHSVLPGENKIRRQKSILKQERY